MNKTTFIQLAIFNGAGILNILSFPSIAIDSSETTLRNRPAFSSLYINKSSKL
jgi:hypothetical protein